MKAKKLFAMGVVIFSLSFYLYGSESFALVPTISSDDSEQEIENERITMQEAYNNRDGACAFRALLGIAETRFGRNLTLEQLIKAREMYYGSTVNRNWWVTIRRSDGQTQGSNNALEDVINIGLELLGSNERALLIRRVTASPTSRNIPPGTQATFIRVSSVSTSNLHFLEGDADGNMIFDPLDALDFFKTKTIIAFDAIRFYTPE